MKKNNVLGCFSIAIAVLFFCLILLGLREDDETELTRAVNHGDVDKIRDLIKSGADVNKLLGQSALMANIGKNYQEPAEILLKSGAKIDLKDGLGNTALAIAAGRCDLRWAIFFLDRGAHVNTRNNSWYTPLMICLDIENDKYGVDDKKMIKIANMTNLLITHGANVNTKSLDGTTPLMLAANRKGAVEIVRTLIQKGANVKASRKNGDSVLSIALRTGDNEIINEIKKTIATCERHSGQTQ